MKRSFSVLVIFFSILACNEVRDARNFRSPDEIVNPNGDSELALVMREIHFEANRIGREIEEGEEVDLEKLKTLAAQLSTAEPTDPNETDENYYLFANKLEQKVEALESDEIVVKYNEFVNTCIACHRNTCPGPIGKIRKLRIKA